MLNTTNSVSGVATDFGSDGVLDVRNMRRVDYQKWAVSHGLGKLFDFTLAKAALDRRAHELFLAGKLTKEAVAGLVATQSHARNPGETVSVPDEEVAKRVRKSGRRKGKS